MKMSQRITKQDCELSILPIGRENKADISDFRLYSWRQYIIDLFSNYVIIQVEVFIQLKGRIKVLLMIYQNQGHKADVKTKKWVNEILIIIKGNVFEGTLEIRGKKRYV